MNNFLRPVWPAPANVRATFTTRAGGVSAAPFDSLNLGDHVQDDPASVRTNRAILRATIGARPVFLRQVHGVDVVLLDALSLDGTQADGCFTTQKNVACTAMVADCLPVLFTNRSGTQVAAAHAGWRGLVGGVLEQTYQCFMPLASVEYARAAIKKGAIAVGEDAQDAKQGNDGNEVIAWLGPCIGPSAFEVGAEVREAFVAVRQQDAQHFVYQASGKYLANLSALARSRLAALGITQICGNDGTDDWCTVLNPSKFFSHRRDTARLGSTGRMAACVWMDGF